MKKCRTCQENKPLAEFHSHASCAQGVRPDCKVCLAPYNSKRSKDYATKDPDQRRFVIIKHRFGLTKEQYLTMFEAQGFGCKICNSKNPGAGKKYFSIDHCHKTNKIRGILCHGCNAGLGMFQDSASFLLQAVEYLKGNN